MENQPLVFLSPEPRMRAPGKARNLAPRLSDFNDRVLGIVDDGFADSWEYLSMIQTLISKRYPRSTVRAWHKPILSRPAPDPLIEEISETCDAVIIGVGA